MKKILNFLNVSHKITLDQQDQLIRMNYELVTSQASEELRTKCSSLHAHDNLVKLADEVAALMEEEGFFYILLPIGSPVFQFILADRLKGYGCLFSHTERKSVEVFDEKTQSTQKTFVFKHEGFHVCDGGTVTYHPFEIKR